MRTIKPLNNALGLTLERTGDNVVLTAEFQGNNSKQATVSIEQLRQVMTGQEVYAKGVKMGREEHAAKPRQRPTVSLYFTGGGYDLVVVSASELRRAVGM